MSSTMSHTNSTEGVYELEQYTLDAKHIALYLMLSFFSVLGVIGNAIAFYIFFRRRNSGTSVIFILALAGTDFITCLVTVPYTMVFEAMQYRLYYDGLCKMYMFFLTSTIPYSSFIMAGIAFDRYFCICHPFLHVLNVQRARMVVLCLAVPAFTFGIITGMSYGMYRVDDTLIVNGSYLIGTDIPKSLAEHPEHPTPFINSSRLEERLQEENGVVLETDVMFNESGPVYRVKAYRMLVHNTECFRNNFHFSEEFQTWFHRVYTSCYLLCFVTVMVLYVLIYKVSGVWISSMCTICLCESSFLLVLVLFIFNRRAMKAKRHKKNYYTNFIFNRRAMKAKRRKKNYYTSVANTEMHVLNHNTEGDIDTQTTEVNNFNGSVSPKGTADNCNSEGNAPTTTTTTTTATTAANTSGETTATAGDEDGKKSRNASSSAGSVREKTKDGSKNTNGTTSGDYANESTRLPKRRGSTTRDRNMYANIKTAMMLFVVTLVFLFAFAPAWFMAHDLIPMQLNVFYLYFVYNVANPFIYAFMNQTFREDLKKLLKRS
ncbi:uncharacterized protein [Littorina saxatilis]|uniref:uncharacterized protein n=1 Tax=Littorina saxatilis TaxID=31220 RepID=UPI0038B5A114